MNFRLFLVFLGLSGFGLGSLQAAESAGTQALFNGKDLKGWREPLGTWLVCGQVRLDSSNPKALVTEAGEGVLLNSRDAKTVDAVTLEEFGDCRLEVEFCVAKGSNSGIYFQGRYEIQVLDSFGKDSVGVHDCGAIYERWEEATKKGFEGFAPRVNASKAPGEWQAFDITFRAPRFDAGGKKTANAKFVKVLHNGQLLHENAELSGPTRGGRGPEGPLGPIRIQGDHGPVAYRNLKITKLQLP